MVKISCGRHLEDAMLAYACDAGVLASGGISMKTMTKSIWVLSVFWITLGLAVPLSAIPASAESLGVTAGCTFLNANRLQCNFPALSGQTAGIQYVSMQCGSTGTVAYSLQEFQVLTT